MSIQAMSWALEQHVTDPAAKLVLLALCNAYNGDNHRCFPSHSRIAHEASISLSTVKRKLKWLEENGWIASQKRQDSTGRQTTNSYLILMHEGGGQFDTPVGHSCDLGEGVNCDLPILELEERTVNTPLKPPQGGTSPKPEKSKRGSRLPDDWQPSQALLDFAAENGMNEFETKMQVDTFRDYWIAIPGAKGCKLDWDATFKNWVRRSREFAGNSKAVSVQSSPRRSNSGAAKSIAEELRAVGQ